ncbi:hypothetical protein Vadar_033186 [Vaccinium darrowii]|uniref:Uncharacterized protein n=1 Tax=Vaccinium darrowii TaxID=229202 RepID=A0ACB7XLT1_9ERIC|nr:hypothetical protein Vadar_033186 [Vaccinium darrowii]
MNKEKVRYYLMDNLKFKINRDIIRMGPRAFHDLCDLLQRYGGLGPTRYATVEEQVAKGLYLLSHSATNSEVSFFFRRSGETTSRHFHKFLRAVISMEEHFLKQPEGSQVPLEISASNRFYPYFKDYVGALDGTHVAVKVSSKDAPRYRGRKGYPTLNVLAACTFDLRFTYVLPGWEGTAYDSRIIKNALAREDKLKIPNGKYYLVDAGYMLRSGLITPYRGVRYHLKEYSNRPPQNACELFNLRLASLRNAIERTFGVVKKRFPIIGNTQPNYSVDTQSNIILACCIIHNFLMGVDPDEELIAEVDRELARRPTPRNEEQAPIDNSEDAKRGEVIRNMIAATMWSDYVSKGAR